MKNINEHYANAENVEIKLIGSIQNSEIHRFLESKKPEKVDDPLHSVYKFLIENVFKKGAEVKKTPPAQALSNSSADILVQDPPAAKKETEGEQPANPSLQAD